MPVAAALGRAAGAVALDDEDLALGRVALGAVGQLAGQARAFQHGLSPRQLARFSRGFSCARGAHAPIQDHAGDGRVFLQELVQLFADQALDHAAHLAVAELHLGLALKLRLHQLDGHNRGQALADVLALQLGAVAL